MTPQLSHDHWQRGGREFRFTVELEETLQAQRAYTDRVQRERGAIVPRVFHRGGAPIRDFRVAWRTACEAAGIPGRIPHDFRRSAVRNLVRAGVSEHIAMKMCGHKTATVFRRYDIVSGDDFDEAARKLDAFHSDKNATGTVTGKVAVLDAPETAAK